MQKTLASKSRATRDIAFLVFPGFQIQDLSGPLAAFDLAARTNAGSPYRCHVVSLRGGGVVSSSGLEVVTRKVRQAVYDTLIVSGGSIWGDLADVPSMSNHLRMAAAKGTRRIASVCTGAFILAAAGLLDSRHSTTHWKYTKRLQRQFPAIKVQPDRIFTKDRGIWTSAGVTAGIDLALAMIEDDLGTASSRAVAQLLVVYHRRPGGQSQFSAIADMEPASDRIRDVLTYMREHLSEPLLTEQLASVACISPRQFGRTFLAETGETPAKAVERLRVEVARQRVERNVEPIEIIAHNLFKDPERMRRAFIRVLGHPPQSIRRMTAHETAARAES